MSHQPEPLTLPADHLGLYIHIPFCVRKCRYCDFSSQPLGGDTSLADRYLDALALEAARVRATYPRPVHSIFIGGGTPTTLTGAQLRRLWEEVVAPFPRIADAEMTIEANPGTITDDVLAALGMMPLTRVSLGVQSFHADELAMLGRIHSPEEVDDAVAALRALGIPQLNLDLMYALPGQTVDRWQATLVRALQLAPEHLSLYALILEEGTPLTEQVTAGILPLPREEDEEQIAGVTASLLAAAGYTHYEVSNAAPPGLHARHNLGYWLGRDYLGLGVAATSAMGALRWRNIDDPVRYAERMPGGLPVCGYAERLAAPARLLERVMLGLRLCAGFDLSEAEAEIGCTLNALAGAETAVLQREGWLIYDGKHLRLTAAGFPLANMVVARLMAAGNH